MAGIEKKIESSFTSHHLTGDLDLNHLISNQILSEDQATIVAFELEKSKKSVEEILLQQGFVTQKTLLTLKASNTGTQTLDFDSLILDSHLCKLIPEPLARQHKFFLIAKDEAAKTLSICAEDAQNFHVRDLVTATFPGYEINQIFIGTEEEITNCLDFIYGLNLDIDTILEEIEHLQVVTSNGHSTENPVVRLINSLLLHAVKMRASDIHFEPDQDFVRVRFRIDGVLKLIKTFHKSYWSSLGVRLKLLANMDISETNTPQNGRFSLMIYGRSIDFRLSTLPVSHGENFVLRILDKCNALIPFSKLGYDPESIETLKSSITRPSGLMLFTGPTGSGKTTSLYSIFQHLNSPETNIMTLEEPIEYQLPWIRQTEIRESGKLTYASGIKSILRQDPDIIFVGEMRDEETAKMSLRAALTGHQVYSTLHTNDAIASIYRLFDLGIEPSMLAGNMIASVAQRLIRLNCSECVEPVPNSTTMAGVGCKHCDYTGYKGRTAVVEILEITPEIDDLISKRAPRQELLAAAIRNGYKPLIEQGNRFVKSGQTSIQEFERILGKFKDTDHD